MKPEHYSVGAQREDASRDLDEPLKRRRDTDENSPLSKADREALAMALAEYDPYETATRG